MAGKRQATSVLNHDNWDREEEPEERGTFKTANEDELKNRVIKKARRKIATGTTDAADGGSETKSVFSSFSGFGKPAAAATAGSPFSFLAKIKATDAGETSSTGVSTATTSATPTFSFGNAATKTTASSSEVAKSTDSPKTTFSFGGFNASSSTAVKAATATAPTFSFGSSSTTVAKDDKNSSSDKTTVYFSKLKGLNQAISEWIKTHVDKNPLCILTPIFNDYEKYLKELDEEKCKAEATDTNDKKVTNSTTNTGAPIFKLSESKPTGTTASSTTSTFSFLSSTASSTSSSEPAAKTNGFSFGLKKPDETKDDKSASSLSTSGFSFGLKPTTDASSTATSGFTFGKPASTSDEGSAPKPLSFVPGGTPFSFGNIKPPDAPTSTENDDEDEEPPKNDFKQVVEDDAIYSKKCKVYVKKDGNFVDKGVGTLYLKPVESSGKTQMLVRADTNLGNILVNMILSSAIPSQRMGKNNVMLVCLPTPDVEKPTPMLLRVKTGEEADELLETIEKYKK